MKIVYRQYIFQTCKEKSGVALFIKKRFFYRYNVYACIRSYSNIFLGLYQLWNIFDLFVCCTFPDYFLLLFEI